MNKKNKFDYNGIEISTIYLSMNNNPEYADQVWIWLGNYFSIYLTIYYYTFFYLPIEWHSRLYSIVYNEST